MKSPVIALVVGLLTASTALAQDVIEIDSPKAPEPVTAQDRKDQEMGDWARGVMERAKDPKALREDEPAACRTAEDNKAHGVVYAEVGTGGYRRTGIVATQPLGECAQLTVGVDMTDYGNTRRGRGRGR